MLKKIRKVLDNLRKLDLFNTKLVYGAFELGYLTDEYDTISIQAEDTSNDSKGAELTDSTELILGNGETILLHIKVIVKSYIRLDRVLLAFDSIKDEFCKEFQVSYEKVKQCSIKNN